jgi:nucleoside-diphosphate-sugar epimerase
MVVGSMGNLSLALQNAYRDEEIRIVGSDLVHNWSYENAEDEIRKDIENFGINPRVIFNAAGLLDPNASLDELLRVNFHLPKNLLLYCNANDIKLVTFGTVMENLDNLSRSNSYLFSKMRYFDFLTKSHIPNEQSLHLQIHTWYGTVVQKKHMFLGQMFSAVKNQEVFNMSSGTQLREYHHIYDDINAVQYLLRRDAKGIVQVNHGDSLSLAEIATSVFDFFNSLHLLEINSLATPEHEILRKEFEFNNLLEPINFRSTIPGIIGDFQQKFADLE